MSDALLRAEGITQSFRAPGGRRTLAVDDVTLEIRRGEILGLAGESGCGKTTLARVIIGMIAPPERGRIIYCGTELNLASRRERFAYTRKAQMIFQDPYSSLDPRMTAGASIEEGMEIHGMHPGRRRERAAELLEAVGLGAEHAGRFPHEFSGGQRQRIGIARALAVEPELLVCDEPVSALDVSMQAQIVNLIRELRERLGLTCLFIAHDLNVVRYISDRIAVMKEGRIIESGPSDELCANPGHPYTRELLAAVPPVPSFLDRGCRPDALGKRALPRA